jgi:23S rRNA (uracil1939-C5)-methyltransferase
LTSSGAVKTDAASLAREPLVLDDLLENGQGVGRIDGLVTFVTGGLPGERVRIAIDEVKKNYAGAHVIDIEEASHDRVDPGCPVFPRCGGCQTLHLRYSAELEWKRTRVVEALARLGGMKSVEVAAVVTAQSEPDPGYRNKASLVCKRDHGADRLGFYGARSHRLVAIESCPVLLPRLRTTVERVIAFAQEAPQAMRDVEHVIARASATGRDLVIAFSGKAPNRALGGAVEELRRRIPELTGIVSAWDPSSENAVLGRRSAVLWGSPVLRERVLGADFVFGVESFFQINTALLELLAGRIVERLRGARRVVDLYSGVGTFAVLLSKNGTPTTGVETSQHAVDEAAANAAHNGVTNAAFECATAAYALTGERGRSLLAGADAVILDPPRKGCEEGVLAPIAASAVPTILYVSCNPATLARDAAILASSGYALRSVQPFDMFPRTGHVEALAEFEWAAPH